MTKTVGLLVMAYGTPYKESDIEPYYTDIRHGKRPTEEELQDLKNRYEFIGGFLHLQARQIVKLKHLQMHLIKHMMM